MYRRWLLVSHIWSHFSLLIVISISFLFWQEWRSCASIIQQRNCRSNLYARFFLFVCFFLFILGAHTLRSCIELIETVSVHSRLNWNLEVLFFKERGKQKYQEKNLSEQGRKPTTNSTHIWCQHQDSNLGHIGGGRVLSTLHHPCSLALAPKFQATEALSCQQ